MAKGKGGVYGSFVMVKLTLGKSKSFPMEGGLRGKRATDKAVANGKEVKSDKSPMVYMKEPIAKYFGFKEMTPADMVREMTRKVTTTINGKVAEVTSMVKQGATGAGRSVTVKFTKLVKIGGKDVASVKIAMPSSHTYGNMVQEIMESKASGDIAAIVSPEGSSTTFRTPYKNGGAGKPKLK